MALHDTPGPVPIGMVGAPMPITIASDDERESGCHLSYSLPHASSLPVDGKQQLDADRLLCHEAPPPAPLAADPPQQAAPAGQQPPPQQQLPQHTFPPTTWASHLPPQPLAAPMLLFAAMAGNPHAAATAMMLAQQHHQQVSVSDALNTSSLSRDTLPAAPPPPPTKRQKKASRLAPLPPPAPPPPGTEPPLHTPNSAPPTCDNSGRTCLHCGTTKTPLWRNGPKGAKTLCNACGVRFKLGKLQPLPSGALSPSAAYQEAQRRRAEAAAAAAAGGASRRRRERERKRRRELELQQLDQQLNPAERKSKLAEVASGWESFEQEASGSGSDNESAGTTDARATVPDDAVARLLCIIQEIE